MASKNPLAKPQEYLIKLPKIVRKTVGIFITFTKSLKMNWNLLDY